MATIIGSNNSDILEGTQESDIIVGDGGDDLIDGAAGDDIIFDGPGLDVLWGGRGNDTFKLFDNNLFAPSAAFFNPIGITTLSGGPGNDTADATEASEGLVFEATTFAKASIEVVIGSPFDDQVDASDTDFDVVLTGEAGADTLIGGTGNDLIDGGADGDFLQGGAGSNTFRLTALDHSLLSGFDTIADLKIGSDQTETAIADQIDSVYAVAAENVLQLGELPLFTSQEVEFALGSQTLAPLGAATFTHQGRTFLALNDEVAGFQPASDAVIEITGYSGNLADLSIL